MLRLMFINMNEEIIKKTEKFVRDNLFKIASQKDANLRMAEYRIEHSNRVARIALAIAKEEGLNMEGAYIAGLLHDIGYSMELITKEEHRNHGRIGAKIARPFLESLGYDKDLVNEICYGIAIHVDDESDFDGERTKLALTVQDADNIDRFDAFRLYEGLVNVDYRNLSLEEQEVYVNKVLNRLVELRSLPFGTNTAKAMWEEKIDFQIEFYSKLKIQIENSKDI